jgi:hypothetical protein
MEFSIFSILACRVASFTYAIQGRPAHGKNSGNMP